jgi:hypothetical protein
MVKLFESLLTTTHGLWWSWGSLERWQFHMHQNQNGDLG